MAHTHEFDCVICGAHLDSQDDLARHNRDTHSPKIASPNERAEPMGNEQRRTPDPGDDIQS